MSNPILSIQECDEIFSGIILPRFIELLIPQENPKAHISGGQPGAGKSHFIRVLKNEPGNENFSVINSDDLRGYHPFYYQLLKNDEQNAADLTQKNVNYWTEKLIQEIADRRGSMIIEGTMKNPEVPIRTAEMLSALQYEITANIILTNPKISNADIFFRYIEQKRIGGIARFTKPGAHEEAVNRLYKSILTVNKASQFDHVKIYYRKIKDYELLYEKFSQGDRPVENEEELALQLKSQIGREIMPEEIDYVEKSWDYIFSLSKENKTMLDFLKKAREQNIDYFSENKKDFQLASMLR